MTTIGKGHTKSPSTLSEVADFIKQHCLADEEYFSLSFNGRRNHRLDEPLYLADTRWVAVYCVEGGSEGYYVHVERVSNSKVSEPIFLGKFWCRSKAMEAVTLMTACVNGWEIGEPDGRVKVDSSTIASVGYDAANEILEIEFQTGAIYHYYGVAPEVHERLMSAESHGTYFNAAIKKGGYLTVKK